MTERMKKILYGIKGIKPKTSAEKAVKFALDNAGGDVHVPFTVTVDQQTGAIDASTTANFEDVVNDVLAGKTIIADVDQSGMFVEAPLLAKNSKTNPTGLLFSYACDFSDNGTEPAIYVLRFTNIAPSVKVVKLAVAV